MKVIEYIITATDGGFIGSIHQKPASPFIDEPFVVSIEDHFFTYRTLNQAIRRAIGHLPEGATLSKWAF